MDIIDVAWKLLAAVVALAGAAAAYYKWMTKASSTSSSDANISGTQIQAGRDVNVIQNSFNRKH